MDEPLIEEQILFQSHHILPPYPNEFSRVEIATELWASLVYFGSCQQVQSYQVLLNLGLGK